jgi:hypothetical protein
MIRDPRSAACKYLEQAPAYNNTRVLEAIAWRGSGVITKADTEQHAKNTTFLSSCYVVRSPRYDVVPGDDVDQQSRLKFSSALLLFILARRWVAGLGGRPSAMAWLSVAGDRVHAGLQQVDTINKRHECRLTAHAGARPTPVNQR